MDYRPGLQRVRESRWISLLLLAVTYHLVASAAHLGFMSKWALRDGEPFFGFEVVIEGEAYRPFAYRLLAPELARLAAELVPSGVQGSLLARFDLREHFGAVVSASHAGGHAFEYLVLYLLSYLGLLASAFLLRAVLLEVGFGRQRAALAPGLFVLAFPYIETIGGYYYDSLEVAFLAGGVLFALRGSWLLLLLMTVPATLNKEAFLLFVPTLYPLLRQQLPVRRSALVVAGAGALALATNLVVKQGLSHLPGSPMQLQLGEHLAALLDPATYTCLEVTYGLPGPEGFSPISLLVIGLVVVRGWGELSLPVRRHLLLAACINVPLFLAFCYPGELRNLSLLHVAFVGLLAGSLPASSGRGRGRLGDGPDAQAQRVRPVRSASQGPRRLGRTRTPNR